MDFKSTSKDDNQPSNDSGSNHPLFSSPPTSPLVSFTFSSPPSNTPVLNGENISFDNTPATITINEAQQNLDSPPPESIHSQQLSSLSPPPLETSRIQEVRPTAESHRKRPPRPRRWAPTGTSELPRQIGSVSHRRVQSSGDASCLSNLTDPDSIPEDESPPLDIAAGSAGELPRSQIEERRRRGVSWDFGRGEEEQMFEAMGILQPVLSEEEGETSGAIISEPPPPPPESRRDLTKKDESSKTSWDTVRNKRKSVTHLSGSTSLLTGSKLREGTQFEDEAEWAILQAMGAFDHMKPPSPPSSQSSDDVEDHSKVVDDAHYSQTLDEVPSNVNPSFHHKSISSITSFRHLDTNSVQRPSVHNLNQRGEMLFENQAWHDDYDSKGRIDGTLREERDTMVVEEELGIKLDDPIPAVEPLHGHDSNHSVLGLMKTLHIFRDKTGGSEAEVSEMHRDKPKDTRDETHTSKGDVVSPKKIGHKRTQTKTNVIAMAEELAKMASLDNPTHQRIQTHGTLPGDKHGINNLLDGVDVLYSHDELKDECNAKPEEIEDDCQMEKGSHEDDEEMGHRHNRDDNRRATFVSVRQGHKKGNRKRETVFYFRRWYSDLIAPKVPTFVDGLKRYVLLIFVPMLSLAFILFYACGNPMAGKFSDMGVTINDASWSWWILFIVRQSFILGCVRTGEVITIDIIALRTPLFVKVLGSFLTLMFVQARGWPYVIMFWGLMHLIGLFNSDNPGGSVVNSEFYMRVLLSMIAIGVLTSLKRLWLATFLGRRSYIHYGPELEIILAKMLLISQVAQLSRQIEAKVVSDRVADGFAFTMTSMRKSFAGLITDSEEDNTPQPGRKRLATADYSPGASSIPGGSGNDGFGKILIEAGIDRTHFSTRSMKQLTRSTKQVIMALLDEWEEPSIGTSSASKTNIKDILQFRQAVSMMSNDYCFTPAFGPTTTRTLCVESSLALFNRLVENDPNISLLPFETLSQIAYDNNGKLRRDKVKALIKLFRPDRIGYMEKIDFLSSIDSVYRDLRIFRASLQNSSQVDNSFESIVNVVFYAPLVFVVLMIMGIDVWQSFLSFATFFFGFSFVIGPASSRYFEGLLLILVRRPYDIGDKIALSDPASDTDADGSSTWFVEQVTLFTTTVRYASTNEVATYSNGSLAQLRIINAKRSPKAVLYVYMKFGSNAPFQLLKVFHTAIENFIKARPREWAQLNGIRANRVEMELNYVEYIIVATHREMWQNIGPILSSKADLASFSLEVSKKLNLRYQTPPKPIQLSLSAPRTTRDADPFASSVTADMESVANLFPRAPI